MKLVQIPLITIIWYYIGLTETLGEFQRYFFGVVQCFQEFSLTESNGRILLSWKSYLEDFSQSFWNSFWIFSTIMTRFLTKRLNCGSNTQKQTITSNTINWITLTLLWVFHLNHLYSIEKILKNKYINTFLSYNK